MQADADVLAPVLGEKGMMVSLPSGEAYFNYYWLREADPACIDPVTQERVFDIAALPAAPRAAWAELTGDSLVVGWEEGGDATRLPAALLETVARTGRAEDPAEIPRRIWYRDFYPSVVRISQSDLLSRPETKAKAAHALIEDGIALITEMENSDESLTRTVEAFGPITTTAEGQFFDVRLEIAPTNLAFTAGALEMHTDLPGEEAAPGVQFLHCRANSVEGGRSLFLDGAAVAAALKEEDPEAFDLLATYEIPFCYRHDGWDYRAHQRVIETSPSGEVTGVTISQHLQDVIDLPQDRLDTYYPAFCRFLRLLQEERFVAKFRLNAGECIVFDNHRIVHGREAFSAESGERHLRGAYTDRGALRSTYRVLVKQGYA